METKISVVIAAYNVENYIERCLGSLIKNRGMNDVEIIVVNDGSTDRTKNKIEEYLEKSKSIKLINIKNVGSSEARKIGYENSNGEYIWFVDADDWVEKNSIDIIKKNLMSYVDLLIFDYFISFDKKEKIEENKNNRNKENIDLLKGLLTGEFDGCLWNKIIKKEFLEEKKIEFPRGISMGEDTAFSIAMALEKPKVNFVNENLYNYYQREDSISKKVSEKTLEIENMIEFVGKILKEKKNMEIMKEEYQYFIYLHTLKYRNQEIFIENSIYSEKLFNIWKKFNINIMKNKYFGINEKKAVKIYMFFASKSLKKGKMIMKIVRGRK